MTTTQGLTDEATTTDVTVPPTDSRRRRRRMRSGGSRGRRTTTVAAIYLAIVIASAVFAPILAPYDPADQNLLNRLAGWGGSHLLGTDDFGRDVLSRLLYGGRATLLAASIAVLVSLVVGVPAGLLAGYRGGRIDSALSRVFDGLMSVPALILALTIVAVLGPGLVNAMVAVGLVFAPQFFRVARASTLEVMGESFIEAAVSIGCRPRRVVLVHVFPNVLPSILVQISVTLGVAVSAEASLSFLGLGVEAPTASWGSMLTTAGQAMTVAPFLVVLPGLVIFSVVLAFMSLGDGLRRTVGRVKTRGTADD